MNRIKIRWYRHSSLVFIMFFITVCYGFLYSENFNVRIFDHKEKNVFTRVVFESEVPFEYTTGSLNILINKNLSNIVLKTKNMSDKIKSVNYKSYNGNSIFNIDTDYNFYIWRKFILNKPFRLVVDLKERKKRVELGKIKTEKNDPRKEENKKIIKTSNQERLNGSKNKNSSVKRNKLKKNENNKDLIICIDPGHGGENYGAIGKYLKEKDVTLSISKILKRLIVEKLKLKVIMIRNGDYDVSLNKRAEIANKNHADIFISIHINSSVKKGAKGPETYFVSLKATDKDAFELARKENMSYIEIEKKVKTEALKKILWDMAQTDYIRHSSKLADYIQRELNVLMHTRNRGVKQAPFRVLMRVSMPAVLVEIGFISDREEEHLLMSSEFRKKAAYAVFKGLRRYIRR